MLQAGGLTVVTDGLRQADDHNPAGYFEFERVKTLDTAADKTWLRDCRGRVVKIISFLLRDLPDTNNYRVIFMHRPIEEILRSQQAMLRDTAPVPDAIPDDRIARGYQRHLDEVAALLGGRPCFEVLDVNYAAVLADPAAQIDRINRFFGGELDGTRMVAVVDQRLYRNRGRNRANPGPLP
jgi:hypothetical protein